MGRNLKKIEEMHRLFYEQPSTAHQYALDSLVYIKKTLKMNKQLIRKHMLMYNHLPKLIILQISDNSNFSCRVAIVIFLIRPIYM